MGFSELFTPRAVAVFGSVAEGKLGGILVRQLAGFGFEHLYAVNPKGLGVDEIAGYAALEQIGEPVDLAVIATPAAVVPQVLEDCGKAGVRAAVIISSGFSEAGNAEGEREIKRIADHYGICFIGPNCAGLINTHHKLAPTLQAYPPAGYTAVISQSGAVGGAIMEWAQQHGLGISKFASYGNGADLNQVEFLRYLKDDAQTKVVAVYIENVENGADFIAALKELTAVKPVIALKAGRSNSGQRAAMSHTGSMAGADAVYDAAFREAGAIRVDSLDELIDLCKGFSYLPPVKGRKVAIVTNSGGPGVMTADLGELLGMDIADSTPDLRERLQQFLPAWAGFHNPIDMTVEGSGENYRRVIEAVATEYDAVLPIAFCPPYLNTRLLADGILAGARNIVKPVFCALETGRGAEESRQYLRDNGLPNFPSTERAMRVIAYMADYEEYRARRAQLAVRPDAPRAELFAARGQLLEPEAMQLLRDNDISTVDFVWVRERERLAAACESLGWPVVIKVVSPQIIHKSDVGGVRLNIKEPQQAVAVFDELRGIAAAMEAEFCGVVVYPQLGGQHELIFGLTYDAQFGPVVAFGLGGVYTELLRDVALRIAPVNQEGALEMIRQTRAARILAGARGQQPCDIQQLAAMLANYSQLPFRYPDIAESDLNPVFVSAAGARVGDVRILGKK